MDYKEKAFEQEVVVKKLQAQAAESPTDELTARLIRETDLLRYFKNAATGQPERRARQAARRAFGFVKGKIVP